MRLTLLRKYKTDFCKYLAFIIFNKTEGLYSGNISEVFTLLINEVLQSISEKLDHKLLTLGFDFIANFKLSIHDDNLHESFFLMAWEIVLLNWFSSELIYKGFTSKFSPKNWRKLMYDVKDDINGLV